MASYSSSPLWKFDVFLSFRGEDTRKTFVSHLFKELVRMGIRSFKDDAEIQKGKSISPELQQAIRESKFAIVVISHNYASSSWCLDELLEIVKCEENGSLTIFPVFYEVAPSDVKKQKGPFAESFQRHEDNPKVNPDKVQRWKEALTKVATIDGEDSRNWKEDSKLIEKIVGDISNQLVSTTSSDFSDLVGMERHMKVLSALLDLESTNEVRMIGIWGMPGVGKTTLARYVYEAISKHFQAHCFVEDVKKLYRDHGPTRLQEELLSKNFGGTLTIRSLQVGSNVIKARLGHQKVLVVIDDVDAIEQLNVLAKYTNWFGPGSRIIVTTQNKHLLVAQEVDHVYKVDCLTQDIALQLFNLCAFKNKQPLKGFERLSVQAASYAIGLPLALTVLGSFLRMRGKEEWERTFRRLEESLDSGIKEILKVSYDGLDEQEKTIFLHVACLFDGERVEDVSRILGGDQMKAEIGIQTLTEKSLIVISNRGNIGMHGLLQKMGRELARGSRLLTDPEEIGNALTNNKVNKEIEGISLDVSMIKRKNLSISDRALKRLSNLKFLKVYNHRQVNDEAKVHLPDSISLVDCKLKYLHWDVYPLRNLQFRLDSLVVLNMQRSKLEKLWEGSLPLKNLKRIDLQESKNLREIPDLSEAPNLEYLDVSSCERLIEVPSSIKGLNKLAFFTLNGCSELTRLPDNINLKSLQILTLKFCERLEHFPQISQNIRSLCVELTSETELPDSIGNLSYIVELEIYECRRLKTLPITMRNLRSLQRLKLEGCEMLGSFPDEIKELVSLTKFEVTRGRKIKEIPHLPPNLRELTFTGTSIEVVPSWIGHLSKLQIMDLKDNRRMKDLPADISKLECLKSLRLGGCSSLKNLPFELCKTMSSLKDLSLSRTSIKGLPDNFKNLTSLKSLFVRQDFYEPDGEHLPCPPISSFSMLRALELRNLNMVEIPDDIGHYFPHLERLDLSGNDFHAVPASIKHLSSLYYLYLCNCKNLRSLPEVSSTVKEIYARGCVSLETASKALVYSIDTLILCGCMQLGPKEVGSLAQRLASKVGGRKRWPRAWLTLSKVPRCFKHQAKGPSLTIHLLRSHSISDVSGFVACVVVVAEGHYDISKLLVDCDYDFRDNYGHSVYRNTLVQPLWPFGYERMDVESEQLFLCKAFFERDLHMEPFQDLHLSFNLHHPEKGTSAGLKVKACGIDLLFQEDRDDLCDDKASANETSDEELEGSNKKQRSVSSSLTCSQSVGGLRVSSEEAEDTPNNEGQEIHELQHWRGKFFKLFCITCVALRVFSGLYSH